MRTITKRLLDLKKRAGSPFYQELFNFEDELDFHGDIEGERRDADGGAGVLSSFLTEDFDEEIGAAVGDGGVGAKLGGGGDEDACFDDLGDFVERTDFFLERGKGVEGTLAGALDGCGFIDLGGDDAFGEEGAFGNGDLA